MLLIYRLCLIIGGIFVLLSAIGGLDGADLELDEVDGDAGQGFETDLELTEGRRDDASRPSLTGDQPRRGQPGISIFSILTSFKFWTFGSCFFGLTGLLLSGLQPVLSPLVIAILAVIMGILCGTGMALAIRILQRRQVNSLVQSSDLVGLVGTVAIPFDATSRGKVRLRIKGATLDVMAYTDAAEELAQGERVLVVGTEQNRVWVVPEATLLESPPE